MRAQGSSRLLAALCALLIAACSSDGSGSDDPGEADAADLPGIDAGEERGDANAPEPFIAVHSRTGIAGGTHGGGVVPGGMVAGHFYLPAGGLHEMLDGTMRVSVDPGDSTSYFFAQQFWFDGGDGGYMGLQTNGIIGSDTVGKMLIFSIWEVTEASPGPGATCQPFGGEGVGMSCRLPFEWEPDVPYRLRIRQTQTEDEWRVIVTAAGGDPKVVGDIRVDASWGLLEPMSTTFTEYYGPVGSCETIPLAEASFEDINADDGAVRPERADAETYGTCVTAATASCSGDACVAL